MTETLVSASPVQHLSRSMNMWFENYYVLLSNSNSPTPPPPPHLHSSARVAPQPPTTGKLPPPPPLPSRSGVWFKSSTPRRRVIRFADERQMPIAQVYYCLPCRKTLSLVDRGRLWLDGNDLMATKQQVGELCRRIRDQGYGELLVDTVMTYKKTANNDKAQMRLNRWVQQGTPLRGLERHVNRQHGMERDQVRLGTIRAVLEAQKRMKAEGKSSPEILAKISSNLSQPSRELARKLALADQTAVVTMLQQERTLRQVKRNNF